MKRWIGLAVIAATAVFAYLQITIFVVQPIGALPEGRTVILWRKSPALNFVDSADAVCDRLNHGVSLLCRGIAIAGVVNNNPILLRLPYSRSLYLISTNGQEWQR